MRTSPETLSRHSARSSRHWRPAGPKVRETHNSNQKANSCLFSRPGRQFRCEVAIRCRGYCTNVRVRRQGEQGLTCGGDNDDAALVARPPPRRSHRHAPLLANCLRRRAGDLASRAIGCWAPARAGCREGVWHDPFNRKAIWMVSPRRLGCRAPGGSGGGETRGMRS